ncbi:sterol desaturase family protein [Clostridium manihotivorum]|uniref:Fatty acid hydroxylase domain-containing protein n=1 Tax=Clostridium manihotivorum TaxID=2320868 RepID=A0A410DTW3_9CLOT|nr:sterol desaturase family protein [Clostridium manihotivorum]QAA32499.1 hypothetical protein C1I91_13105 [Clostridium manihotivorum]
MGAVKDLSTLIMLMLIIVAGFLYSSLVEYCLHRFLLHHSYEQEHVRIHHKVYHGIESYELEEIEKDTVLSSIGEILRNVALYLPVAIAIFIYSKAFGVLFLIVCIAYNMWEEFVHFYFHKKNKLFIEELKFYRNLKEHHRVHHYAYMYNYGIGTSFWDIVFRTKKKA